MTVWNATELPQKDRFPFWKEVLCQEYVALNSTTEGDAPFFGHVRANLLNSVNITTISSSRQKFIAADRKSAGCPSKCTSSIYRWKATAG